jgi:glycosyltransferase involved in cell wall biosynthesis
MKILHIETGKNLYGGALQVYYLLKGLQEFPFQRHELVCAADSDLLSKCQEVVTCHPLTIRGDGDIVFLLKLIKLIRHVQPAIVHVHSRRGAELWGGLAAKLCAVRSILTRRVDNPETKLFIQSKSYLFNTIITISHGITQVMIRQGVAQNKLRCVQSAVDSTSYQKTCNRKWFRQEFNLNEESRVVGVIAQLIERKGHRFLLQCLPQIIDHCPQTTFIFFGQGPLQEELAARIQELGLEESVFLAGFRHDLQSILPCLDLVVHPAVMEGLGVSLLQAAAAGVPIVATSVGGIPEIVQDGQNGFLVPYGDTSILSHAIIRLLTDHELAARFSRAGKARVQKHFSIQAMVQGNVQVYKEIIGQDE